MEVTSKKGGLLALANNDMSSKYLWSFRLLGDIEAVSLEIMTSRWKFLSSITDLLDHYHKSYEDFVIMVAFKENDGNPATGIFLNQYKCKNIIKSKTCYSSQEASWINLIIASRHNLNQFSQVFKTGINDHKLMIYTMLKSNTQS